MVDHTFWVSPLPPDGPVTFVIAWSAFGVTESRTVVDSAPIRAVAEHALTLWQPQPTAALSWRPPRRAIKVRALEAHDDPTVLLRRRSPAHATGIEVAHRC